MTDTNHLPAAVGRSLPEGEAIARQSHGLSLLFTGLFAFGCLWAFAEFYVPLKQFGAAAFARDTAAFQQANREVIRLLLQTLPAFALLGGLRAAARLFRAFADGAIFSADSGRLLGEVGNWLLLAGVLGLVGLDPPGEVSGFPGPADAVLAALGLAVRLVGRAWRQAAAIKAENDQFV